VVNDYDKFAKARQEELLKGKYKVFRYIEKPMMKSMLPNLEKKKVLMLGCGTGDETIMLSCAGAQELIGIDLSKVSIEIAKEAYPQYNFLVCDMHNLPFEDESFDFVYSSLAVHYSDNPKTVYDEVYRVLKKGGQFLFSVGHPLRYSTAIVYINNLECKAIGFTEEYDGPTILHGNYLTFGPHKHFYKTGEVLNLFIGPPSMHFKLLKESGFSVEDFRESKCVEEAGDVDMNYYVKYSEIPQFMAFLAQKK
jgi:SAM-dependent methyltransferase